MALTKIYRGMQNGAEAIEENFKDLDARKLDDLGLSEGEVLWTGEVLMAENHIFDPRKKLSQCKNGWIFKWTRYNHANATTQTDWFVTVKIHKSEIGRHTFILPHAGESVYSKKLIDISDNLVFGHNSNNPGVVGSGAAFWMVLVEVKSW